MLIAFFVRDSIGFNLNYLARLYIGLVNDPKRNRVTI